MDYRSDLDAYGEPTDLFTDLDERPTVGGPAEQTLVAGTRNGQRAGLAGFLGAVSAGCGIGSLFVPWIVAEAADRSLTLDATTPYALGLIAVIWSLSVLFSTWQVTRAKRRWVGGVLVLLAGLDLVYLFTVFSATGMVKMGLRWANSLSSDVDVSVSFGAGFFLHVLAGFTALLASLLALQVPTSDRQETRS